MPSEAPNTTAVRRTSWRHGQPCPDAPLCDGVLRRLSPRMAGGCNIECYRCGAREDDEDTGKMLCRAAPDAVAQAQLLRARAKL